MPDAADRTGGGHTEGGHTALLTHPTARSTARIEDWLRSARARGEQVVTVAAPAEAALVGRDAAGAVPELGPAELGSAARTGELLRRALAAGHRGLAVLVRADVVMASTPPGSHVRVEAELARLRRDQPVSVLCLYDRAGADHLDLAVAHHAEGIGDDQAHAHRLGETLHLQGEFDADNVDVLAAVLRAAAVPPLACVDVGSVRFTSAAAVRALSLATGGSRRHAGGARLTGASPHLDALLRLLPGHAGGRGPRRGGPDA